MEDIKARGRIPCIVALALGLLSACGQGGTTFEGDDDQKLGTPVPSAIHSSNLPDSSLLRVFLDVNGERRPMTINGGAVATTVNLPVGTNIVAIVFEYQSWEFGDVILATATQTLNLRPGQNTLAFNEQDYQFPDDDGDGSTNLAEIRSNTDPDDPNDLLRQWGVAGSISNPISELRTPSLAVDASGNGLAVWSHVESGVNNIWANRFAPDTGWGVPMRIATDAAFPQVAMDANGNGIAIWRQGSFPALRIVARRFDPASGWGASDRLDLESSGEPGGVRLTMSANGVAVAVWIERDEPAGYIRSVWASRFDGTAWGGATLIESSPEFTNAPEVTADADGNALAIWVQAGNLWANRFIADTGWGTAMQIERLEGGSGTDFNIAMDSNGNGMAVWVQTANLRSTVRAAHFDAATSMWGDAILIESPSLGASPAAENPNVAFDAAGNALVVWQHDSGEGVNNIWANRFDAVTTAWGIAALVEEIGTQATIDPAGALAVRANGEAWALWSQSSDIYANRFDPVTQAWGTPVLVDDNSASATATIALAGDGRGLALWAGVQRQPGSPNTFAILSNRLQ